MGILKRIKDWLVGDSKKKKKNTAVEKIKEANRVTNYGGGVKTKSVEAEVKRSIIKAEKKKAEKTSTATSSSAFKATPPSVRKAEAKDKQTRKSSTPSAFKASAPPALSHQSTALGTMSKRDIDARTAKANAYNENRKYQSRAADKLKPLIDDKYSTRKGGVPAYIKQGNYAADPDVAKYNVLKHPIATSATRGGLGGATLGLSELAIQKMPKSKEMEEAERFYQANKSKGAETLGTFAGAMLPYGGTASVFENLGTRAVERAAGTSVGKKLGAEALGKAMAGEGAKAAIARSLVGDAIQDSTLGLIDTMAGVAQRDDLKGAGDYLKAIAAGQAANYGMGLAGNVVAHGVAHGAPIAREAWENYVDESRRMYIVPPSVADVAEATAKPKTKTVIANNLDKGTRDALLAESSNLDSEWWALRESIEQEYGSVNPNYRELTPEQRVDVTTKKNRMKEITARKNEISEDLRIVRHVEEPQSGASTETAAKTEKTPKAEKKKNRAKPKNSAADAKTYAEFVEANKKNADVVKRIKAGEDPKDIWQNARIEKGRENIRLTSLNDAKKSLYDSIPENEVQGWFNDANSGYKPRIVERIAENPDALNASMNVAYRNYLDTNPKSVMSFDEWLDTPQTYYRGTRGQAKVDDDVFSGFTPYREVAEKFAGKNGKVDEITIAPRQTYGSIMTNGESEILIPESAIKQYAKGIKTSKSDPLKAYKEKRLKENPNATFDEAKAKESAQPKTEPKRRAESKPKVEPKAEAKTEPPKARKRKPSKSELRLEEVNAEIERADAEIERLRAEGKGDDYYRAIGKANDLRIEQRRLEKNIERAEKAREKRAADKLTKEYVAKRNAEKAAAVKAETKAEPPEVKANANAPKKAETPAKGEAAKATQEDFDRDIAEFKSKIGENGEKVSKLQKELQSASNKRKQAIKEEIKKLDEEVKTMRNKAGLKYHPDKGGKAEWMETFNGLYNDYHIGDYSGLKRPKDYAKRTQRAMSSVEEMVGASKTKKGVRETLRQFRDEADRKFVDSMKDFEQVARERKKTLGKKAMEDLYGAINKVRSYRAIATNSVGSHQMKWDGTRYKVTDANGVLRDAPSLAEIFSGMDKDTEKSFNAYLLLNHNVDRLREGKPIFEDTVIYNDELSKRLGLPKDIDLMDADVCKKLAEDYEARFSNFNFKDRAAQIRQYTANELNNRVHAGLLSKEKMDEWLHDHPNYVPTYREGLFDGVGADNGAVMGASDLKAAKGSDLNIYDIKEQLADATVRNWRDMSLNNLLENTFGENISKMAVSANVDPQTFVLDHTMNVGKAADGGKYYANIYRGGKAERVEIEKRFYDDLKDLYKNGRMGNGLDGLNDKVLVPLADKWKKLITEWSPIFMVKNFMRDFPEAIINSRNRKEFLEITADFSALTDLVSGGKFSRSLRDAGISTSTFIDIDKAVKEWEKGNGNPLKLIGKLNAGVEMYPRLVEYMATIKKAGFDLKTVSIEDIPMSVRDRAAANAADVTVNFGRSGSVGKLINKGAVPFFNPSVQGWSKFARNVSELDGFKDTVGFLLATTALGTAPMVATNLLYQNNPNYQQISARDKANNYIIALPPSKANTTDTFIKIPRSRFASVYGLPLANVANENKMGWAEAIRVVNDQVAPLNPLESHLGANLIQAARNKTWYGTPIESESMKTLPANERYDATTSGISIKTADALDKITKGKVKVSPKKLDYVLDANLGVAADFALPATTQANKGTPVPKRLLNVGKKAFTIDSAIQNDISTRYYDKATSLEQSKNSKNAAEADKKAYERFNSWNNRVKDVTNAMRYVQSSDIPNKEDAYRELRKLRNEDMLKALDGRTSINNTKDVDIIHKYAGNSYTIENLGKSADKKALKAYSAAVYGDISEDEMRRKIDSDTEFYKGYKGIAKTQNALQKINPKLKGGNALTYAVGLADAGASDDVFASYDTTVKSRTESASKANRAKEYLKNNGSIAEFAQLENVVKNLGKLSDVDKDKLEDEAYKKLQSGKISIDKYNTELKKIDYNANQSYVGKAVSLALSGAPDRAYNLYDIKRGNVQKGYNLAAMGIDSRRYREMSKACDKDGNGYLKTAEIRDYVANSDVKDKATLFDALCYYPNVRNPFGAPKQYSAAQAAKVGKSNGVKQIEVNGGEDNTTFIEGKEPSNNWRGGYYRYGRWHRWGHGGGRSGSRTVPMPKAPFKARKSEVTSSNSVNTGVSVASTAVKPKMNITPLNVKAVKPTKSGSKSSNQLASALEDIKQTEKKVAPPKARRSK